MVGVDHDVAYRQLLAGEIDVIDVYSTDAMIRRGDLVLARGRPIVLSPLRRRLALPARRGVALSGTDAPMRRVEGAISESTMQSLNDEVEAGRTTESQAAAEFLNRATRAARRSANHVANAA